MVVTTQLQNYRNIRNITEKVDARKTPFEGRIPQIIRLCHSTLERVRMTTNHPTLSNARFATFKSTESMSRLRNRTLLDTTRFKNSGIPIHGRQVPQFFMTITNGVQRVLVMTTYPTKLCM